MNRAWVSRLYREYQIIIWNTRRNLPDGWVPRILIETQKESQKNFVQIFQWISKMVGIANLVKLLRVTNFGSLLNRSRIQKTVHGMKLNRSVLCILKCHIVKKCKKKFTNRYHFLLYHLVESNRVSDVPYKVEWRSWPNALFWRDLLMTSTKAAQNGSKRSVP